MRGENSETLLPDRLRELWTFRSELTPDALRREEQGLLEAYRCVWADALRMKEHGDLKESLLAELSRYTGCDLNNVELQCRVAAAAVREEWRRRGTSLTDPTTIERFYDETEAYLFDLMWWHTLADDSSPLAYVVAMKLAMQHGCRTYLDFGAGVGSAGILFARHGFEVTLADISSTLLEFSRWRLRQRQLGAALIDLKTVALPAARYDIVTAMDVWEHLVDPIATVDQLADAMMPGGILYGRFSAETDPRYPQHIVTDFGPTFQRLAERGFVEVWRDDWLWGHQAFQKGGRSST